MPNDDHFDTALLAALNNPEEWDVPQGISMEQAYDLAEECSSDVYEAACRLIFDRKAFISVPLAAMDFDTILMPVTWGGGP
ncbi:MAG: hypothetical protein ACK4SZ_09225 [Allosphingosinicella sp.]|uniref:hypothetical protein n=1 Tax=Allosphingosinicella sp. TaxID=2823234 RepID=UPI00395C5E28